MNNRDTPPATPEPALGEPERNVVIDAVDAGLTGALTPRFADSDSDSGIGELVIPGFKPLGASSNSDAGDSSRVSNAPSSVRGELESDVDMNAGDDAADEEDGEGEEGEEDDDATGKDDGEQEDEQQQEGEEENEEPEAALAAGTAPPRKKKCPHLKAGVKITRVKRLLGIKIKKGVTCQTCTKEKQEQPPNSLFVCLSCGQVNCGRDSLSHAVAHNTNTDHPLSIALNPSGMVWCYACDDEIDAAPGINQVVLECRAMIKEALAAMDKGKDKGQKGIVISGSKALPTVVMPPKVERAKNRLSAPGLRNLGNTCFFNATLQNLAYTQPLVEAMRPLTNSEPTEEAADDSLELKSIYKGPLTSSLATLLVSMNNRAHGLAAPANPSSPTTPSKFSSTRTAAYDDSCDPRPFFGALSNKFQGYRSYQQQDSHEMLRRSVDQMREEQVAKIKEILAAEGKEKPGFIHTFVDEVFGGNLASIVVCDVCKNVSWVSEPFYDLSLPMAGDKDEGKKLGGGYGSPLGIGSSLFNRLKIKEDSDDEKKDEDEKTAEGDIPSEPEPPHPLSQDPAHLNYVNFLLRKVSIGEEPAPENELSLQRCVEQFMTVEELKGSESIRCESCWKHLHGDWEEKAAREKEAAALKAKEFEESKMAVSSEEADGEQEEEKEQANEKAAEEEDQSSSEAEDMKMKNMIDSGVFYMPQQVSVLPKKTVAKKPAPAEPTKPGPVMRSAQKRYLMLHPLPPVLVFHLKRFQQVGWRSSKITKFVSYPEFLDVAGLCLTKHDLKVEGAEPDAKTSTQFRLVGVVVHGGSLHSGHYDAYVRVPARSKEDEASEIETWMRASDSHVREATREEALAAEAYLLFYERV